VAVTIADDYTDNVAHRFPSGPETMDGGLMLILNYSHPLTASQLAQLEALTGEKVDEVRTIPVQLDPEQPFTGQIVELVEAAGLSPEEWQTIPLLLVLPGLNFAAVALLAEVHGRAGYFPSVVRLRPVADAVPLRYEIAEILNLQAIRDAARKRR